MAVDDQKASLIANLCEAKRIGIVIAEEVLQIKLDAGVGTKCHAELPVTLARFLAIGCCQIVLANGEQPPRFASRLPMLRASTVDKTRLLKVPTGKFDISMCQKDK